jgi:NAD(P) transhydrogenase subunit beta
MNVLLAEVDVPYDKLYEMDQVNDEFAKTDLVIVVGANDVINPAANTAEGTPIYGMPILNVHEAKHVIIFNYDTKPGYAGVDNPLYEPSDKVTLLLGDAATTVRKFMGDIEATATATASAGGSAEPAESKAELVQITREARSVIVVPGYGMALAQAQGDVKALMDRLEAGGAEVKVAIHPVAGRMPGHMNVLLAEVDVPYDKLYEMDQVNDEFAQTDLAVVVGANDVINPAANTAEGTPIYGMPILNVHEAKHVIIFNYDTKPGYAGVDNPLYEPSDKVALILGDAAKTVREFMNEVGL